MLVPRGLFLAYEGRAKNPRSAVEPVAYVQEQTI
jgi:hypothetical protein